MQLLRAEARNVQHLKDEVESLSSLRQQVASLSARIVVLDGMLTVVHSSYAPCGGTSAVSSCTAD